MAAGGPGDHWYTDIVRFGLPAFGEPVDSLVRDIVRFGGDKVIDDRTSLGKSLGHFSWPPNRAADTAGFGRLTATLQDLRDRLRRQALENGWEVT